MDTRGLPSFPQMLPFYLPDAAKLSIILDHRSSNCALRALCTEAEEVPLHMPLLRLACLTSIWNSLDFLLSRATTRDTGVKNKSCLKWSTCNSGRPQLLVQQACLSLCAAPMWKLKTRAYVPQVLLVVGLLLLAGLQMELVVLALKRR